MQTIINIPIAKARNIGTIIAQRLKEIEITSLADLSEIGTANAYKKLSNYSPGKHLPLCYYLYSLEGALLDVHWDDLPENRKRELRQMVQSA